ncbi:hypothetical protein N7528_002952 [Penicillium herquei]|nr:hypothetical protein N7528_002952 [Penicillium herquei]
MRLINAKTLQLEEYMDSQIPEYAILSHTWNITGEVSFQEMQGLGSEERDALASDSDIEVAAQTTPSTGYAKIKYTCQRARREGIKYVWVDTCCIDKTSSAELSEAINSMMRWYENSEICYAYLADVPPTDVAPGTDPASRESAFAESRWFRRGWTLQELLAPNKLAFLASDWSYLYSREKVSMLISIITSIPLSLLGPRKCSRQYGRYGWTRASAACTRRRYSLASALSKFSIARRMSWASRRITGRREDRAYCLLGIFGINMPLLYGEGDAAFFRLQEEIIKHSDDQSLFAWNPLGSLFPFSSNSPPLAEEFDSNDAGLERNSRIGFLASSPDCFENSGDYMPCYIGESTHPFSITNKGLAMKVPLLQGLGKYRNTFVLFNCQTNRDLTRLLAIPVNCVKESVYARLKAPIHVAERDAWTEWPSTEIYLLPDNSVEGNTNRPDFEVIQEIPPGLRVTGIFSPYSPDLGHSQSAIVDEIDGLDAITTINLMQGNITNEIRPWHSNALVWFEEKGENPQSFVLCFTLFYNGDKYTPLQLAGFTTESRLIQLQKEDVYMEKEMIYALQLWVEQLAELPDISKENEVSWTVEAFPVDVFEEDFVVFIKLNPSLSSIKHMDQRNEPLKRLYASIRPFLVPDAREQLLRVKVYRVLRSYYALITRHALRSLRFFRFLRFLPWYFTLIVDLPVASIQNGRSWEHRALVQRSLSLVDALYLAESIVEEV